MASSLISGLSAHVVSLWIKMLSYQLQQMWLCMFHVFCCQLKTLHSPESCLMFY